MATLPSEDRQNVLRRRRFRHPFLIGTLYVLWVAVLCWGGLKFFWWWQFGVKVSESPGTETVWEGFYPELYRSGAMKAQLAPDPGHYSVLLLGASVLEQTAPRLEQQLRHELGDRLRLYNLARAAHTSRDSFLKFSHLANRHFDLVIFYHAINDSRMNRCADDAFREDYTHVSFYRAFQSRLAAGRIRLTDFGAMTSRKRNRVGAMTNCQNSIAPASKRPARSGTISNPLCRRQSTAIVPSS